MLGLRTENGISVKDFNETFGVDLTEKYKTALTKNQKYLDFDGDKLKIKDEYLYVQNGIILEFMNK